MEVGDLIAANWRGKGIWYAGKISSISRLGGSVDVIYDDGDQECDVPIDRLQILSTNSSSNQPISSSSPEMFSIGEQVQGNMSSLGKFESAKIIGYGSKPNLFHLSYECKYIENDVPSERIRKISNVVTTTTTTTTTTNPIPPRYLVGDKVLVNWKGKGKFYPGSIVTAHYELGKYDIHYDDGDSEQAVEFSRIIVSQQQLNTPNNMVITGYDWTLKDFGVGERVKVRRKEILRSSDSSVALTRYGRILEVSKSSLSIFYRDNGEIEKNVECDRIQKTFQLYHVGQKVQANWKGEGQYMRATVTRLVSLVLPYAYNITYDNGDTEIAIAGTRLIEDSNICDEYSFDNSLAMNAIASSSPTHSPLPGPRKSSALAPDTTSRSHIIHRSRLSGAMSGNYNATAIAAMAYDVFISHDWGQKTNAGEYENHERARLLSNELKLLGVNAWVETEKMSATELHDLIESVNVVVICITKSYEQKVRQTERLSDHCKMEFRHAVKMCKGRIIAVIFDENCLDKTNWKGPLALDLNESPCENMTRPEKSAKQVASRIQEMVLKFRSSNSNIDTTSLITTIQKTNNEINQ